MKLNDFSLNLRGNFFKPLIQGGMGVDISTSALALAVAGCGGIGHISDAMSPYISDRRYGTNYQHTKLTQFKSQVSCDDKSVAKWNLEHVYESVVKHASATMNALSGKGAIFINIMEKLTMANPKETLRARLRGALDGGISGITLSAGLHTGTLALMADHPRFRDAFVGIIVSSARALKLFLRSASRVTRMPDYIVVEGPLAGGHLGFGMDWEQYNLRSIVQDVLDLLKENELSIPVIPAGGIFTGSDAVSFLQMGASAVQVATRFTISNECGLPTPVKQKYIQASVEDVEVNLTSPTGYPMRMLKSSPSLQSNIKPNCEPLGYILDGEGRCAYREAYNRTGLDEHGKKLPVRTKMCICYHFMRMQCYTCGHNVYRLKETTHKLDDGTYYLPPAVEVFDDYMNSSVVEMVDTDRLKFVSALA